MRSIKSVTETLHNYPFPDYANNPNPDPLDITYTLPDYVFLREQDPVRVGVWDEAEKEWSIELIDKLEYDKTNRLLTFNTMKLAPIAFLQSRCTDYPYVNWKLRCVEDEMAILDIQTMRINLTFEVGVRYMKLIDKTDPELRDIVDKEFNPGDLLIELSKCGIHLMPIDDDAKVGNISLKNRATEEKAIMDITTTVNSFSFRSAKWSRHMNTDKIAVKYRENLEYDREFFEDHENE